MTAIGQWRPIFDAMARPKIADEEYMLGLGDNVSKLQVSDIAKLEWER